MTGHSDVLAVLRQRPDLARLAAGSFDFDLDRVEHVEEVRLASGAPLTAVAGDDTGGTYFVCAGGAVLYASSEGEAGLIGASMDEALEILFGLPGWYDYIDLEADDQAVEEAFARTEDEIRSSYAPRLDVDRSTLLDGLGLRQLPKRELLRRLQGALLRTEPEFLLLNTDEACAYALLDHLDRPPLWQAVLAPGQVDLARMRADREIADDPVRRATVLRAAQYDRQAADLQLLRLLLQHEARSGATEELRLAAVLVGLHGQADDHLLLDSLRKANPDVHFLLGGFPDSAEALARWAADFDSSNYGQDPHDENDLTWTALARRQGQHELARCALIRMLDDAGPFDEILLGSLAREFETLGDLTQAIRARGLHASLQDDAGKRGVALTSLASLQRRGGEVAAAWQSLQQAVAVLDAGPPQPPSPAITWREVGLGLRVTEEHFLITQAAAHLGLTDLAQEALESGQAILDSLRSPGDRLRHQAAVATATQTGGRR
ncbi:hypothetical protein OHA21_05560 [Actinoplanes sp. NBC_00393]|uniref:hypothetical protein n=1 Tax=Actinoplanes sp. NBC_00393 TaxID=2975953 RepID=UPI002E1B91C2